MTSPTTKAAASTYGYMLALLTHDVLKVCWNHTGATPGATVGLWFVAARLT